MNDVFEIIKKAYKPLRLTKKNNCTIIDTTTGSYVIKKKSEKNISNLYKYLKSRSFDYFPEIIEDNRDEYNIYEYVDSIEYKKEQKAIDLIDVISSLHNKTMYYKDITPDKYQSVYENINNNIIFLKNHYQKTIDNIYNEIYMSPSHYLLIRNSSKIFAALDFSKKELDEWFELVKNKTSEKVAIIHNNLSTDHLLVSDKNYLISWENYKTDSPILDIIKFYQNEYFDLNFETLLTRYFNKNNPSEEEKKLLFVVISLPPKIEFSENELASCKAVSKNLEYIYKTENLIRPYYAIHNEE